MCIFTGPAPDVSGTKIFARLSGMGTQYLVYQMTYQATDDVAMVLPLPVSSHAEDAVRFIALDTYAHFFDDVASAFPRNPSSRCLGGAVSASLNTNTLQVHEIGDFEASFVPTLRDFDRLDECFTLPRQVWDQLPAYADFGFAIFKLRSRRTEGASIRVHPMAFEFPTARPDVVFFPTVHVHDGQVHTAEHFDHTLYWQSDYMDMISHLEVSDGPVGDYVKVENAKGLIAGSVTGYKLRLRGLRENRDTYIGAGTAPV